MKRLAVLAVVLALFGAACDDDDDDNPNGPSGQPSTIVFTASLLPANEVPAIGPPENTGTGSGTVTFRVTRDASGNITAATSDWLATFTGFPPGVVGTAAHIHRGATGVGSGPIVINSTVPNGSFTLPQGSGSMVVNNVTITAAEVTVLNEVISNPAGFYYNVHSQVNPGGFVRGQLSRQNP
jgi:hypothetical protein